MRGQKRWLRAVLGLLVVAACVQVASAEWKQPVKVTGGLVGGVAGQNPAITVFKGIPYAAPPVGDLRWRAPQPVQPWVGVRKADKFGNSCIQKVVYERKPWTYEFMSHNDISEDCLFVNVWTPAKSAAEKLPVYLYIHGGGNVEGSGAVPVYNGEGLANKGIVVVTLNYRLGVFGYFAHPELSAESAKKVSGNYAELDVVAALEWIKANIAQFGGDAGQVTIGGQSAGSGHVSTMTVTPLAKGLFRAAINESGVSMANLIAFNAVPLAEAEKRGVEFATAKGAKSLTELRRLSWQEILDPIAPSSPGTPAPFFRFGGAIDGYVLPATMRATYEQGKQNDVPVLAGLNLHDNSGPAPNVETTLAAYKEQAQKRYGALAEEFLALYPASNDAEARVALMQSTWDYNRAGTAQWAEWRAKMAKTKVYTYFWDHTLPGPDAAQFGAFHTSEVPYAMNALSQSDRPFTAADRQIGETLSSYWANFIKTGNPNGKGLANWPSTSEQPGMTMEVGDKNQPIPVTGSAAKTAFFQKYFAKQMQ